MVEVIYKQNEENKKDDKWKKILTEDVVVFKKGNKALDNGNYSEAMERFQEAVAEYMREIEHERSKIINK